MSGEKYEPIQMIERLVAFDTTSRLSNIELIHFVRDYLAGHGVESTLIHDEGGTKANLHAILGPAERPGIALSGHTDVVPVDGQDWSSDPFALVERAGRLYGRGSADMKSFIALALALVPEFLARPLEVPVHLLFSYDEEVGCLGVHGILEHLRQHPTPPRLVIVGEPTSMKVIDAHKGIRSYFTTVTGLEAHSSATHKGVNAIVHAAELIGFLASLEDELRERGGTSAERFDPPYTTISVGVIEGGTALNIIPKSCRFVWEHRSLPDLDENEIPARLEAFASEHVLPRMREKWEGASIVTEPRAHVPGLRPEPGSEAETLVKALAESNRTHAVSFGTEAGLFQADDMAAVVCGPGDIAQAHKPDEYIEIAQIERCLTFMRKLIAHAHGD
jgi:acetylornithine deacetylase